MSAPFRYLIPLGALFTIFIWPLTIPQAWAARPHGSISVGMALQNHSHHRPYWRHSRAFYPHMRPTFQHFPFRHVRSWDRYPYPYRDFGSRAYVGVSIPFGYVVSSLPNTYTTIVVNHTPYYVADGVYFRDVERGYMVVEAPQMRVQLQQQRTYPASDLVVEVNRAHLRSGPGEQHPVTGQAYYGQPLKIAGEAPEWYYVQHPHGHYGWIAKRDTRLTEDKPEGIEMTLIRSLQSHG